MSESLATPHISINPRLISPPWSPYTEITIDAAACGAEMRSWGVTDGPAIQSTTILASDQVPKILYRPKNAGVELRIPIYSQLDDPNVQLFMQNVSDVLNRPATPDPEEYGWEEIEEHRHRLNDKARDVSAHLVEALSRRADVIMLGNTALDEERRSAEKRITLRKAVPRALGALATSTAAIAAGYANHTFNFGPEVTTDTVAALTAIGSTWVAWLSTKSAAINTKIATTRNARWPADLRAKSRQVAYDEKRAAGQAPELVTYRLRQPETP